MLVRVLSPLACIAVLTYCGKAEAQDETQRIPLVGRWNMISAHVIPHDAAIEAVLSQLVERDNLIICKDGQGRFYAPQRNFNNIPGWDYHLGYLLNVRQADTLAVVGRPVAEDEPISLRRGWNMVAYFPRRAQRAEDAFANILRQLIIAKDEMGRYYVPDMFERAFWLRPGRGYQVNVSEDVELVWP